MKLTPRTLARPRRRGGIDRRSARHQAIPPAGLVPTAAWHSSSASYGSPDSQSSVVTPRSSGRVPHFYALDDTQALRSSEADSGGFVATSRSRQRPTRSSAPDLLLAGTGLMSVLTASTRPVRRVDHGGSPPTCSRRSPPWSSSTRVAGATPRSSCSSTTMPAARRRSRYRVRPPTWLGVDIKAAATVGRHYTRSLRYLPRQARRPRQGRHRPTHPRQHPNPR